MIAVVVDEYDLAISHYVNDLGFELIEDKEMTPEKRWVWAIFKPAAQYSPRKDTDSLYSIFVSGPICNVPSKPIMPITAENPE